jgi:hypothetical protein
MLVRDLIGRPLFHLDGDRVRDDSGKPVGQRAGSDEHATKLAEHAAQWMTDRREPGKWLLDLAPADVAQQSTKADFSTPLPAEFIADQACPITYVANDRGTFYAESENDGYQHTPPLAAEDAPPMEINPSYTATKFVCTGYALAARIPRPIAANADFDVKAHALRNIVRRLRLAREIRVATLLSTSTNWATNNRVAAAAKWNSGTTPNQINDMFQAMSKSLLPVDTMILVEPALQFFFGSSGSSTNTRDYVQGGGPMPNILVARAIYSVSTQPAYVWGPAFPTAVPLVRLGSGPKDLQSSQTFRWLGNPGSGAQKDGMLVREFFDSQTDAHWVVCAHSDAEQIINNKVGAIITGALA